MLNLNMSRVAIKLNDILNGRFGVIVQCLPISDKDKQHAYIIETIKRNAGAPLIIGHNQLIVPIRFEGALLGAATVFDINGLLPRQISEIMATIELVSSEILMDSVPSQETSEQQSNVLFMPRAFAL